MYIWIHILNKKVLFFASSNEIHFVHVGRDDDNEGILSILIQSFIKHIAVLHSFIVLLIVITRKLDFGETYINTSQRKNGRGDNY
jgi:hypothetical protein